MLKVDHIGIFVENLDRVIDKLRLLGIPCIHLKEETTQTPRIGFFPIGDIQLEIMSYPGAIQEDSALSRVVCAQKGAINHISLAVDEIEEGIKAFEKTGARVVEGCPMPGAHGPIAFFYPETTEGILIELCEVPIKN